MASRCTRWFLPLLFLPFPVASPYFLLIFLVSLTLHSRPCFYCIILLITLFTSSCYWQPVPAHHLFQTLVPGALPDSSLAPLLYLPNATLADEKNVSASRAVPIPKLTTMVDRCWCELTNDRFFDPYNGTNWQMISFLRTLGLEENNRVIAFQYDHAELVTKMWIFKTTAALEEEENAQKAEAQNSSTNGWNFFSSSLVTSLKSFFPPSKNTSMPPSTLPDSTPTLEPVSELVTIGDTGKGWFRPTYDLRPIGMNAILDLRWGRSSTVQ